MGLRFVLGAAWGALLWGQPVILSGPKVDSISHSSARVVWVTDSNPTSSEIEWGLSTAYGNTRAALRWNAAPYTSTALLTGLSPGTTYHCRARLEGGAVVSGDVTFTTAPEPSPHPAPPAAPATLDVSLPPITGNTYWIDAACSNLQATLDTIAGLSGTANHEIVIPAGTTCYGKWVFPARPNHSGWIVVRSSAASTNSFPPEGVRWTKNWPAETTLAKFVTRALGTKHKTLQGYIPGGTCVSNDTGQGGFYGVVGLPLSVMPLLRCSDSNPAYTGATLITGMAGSNPVTITAPGHTLVEGQVISVPSNGYIPAQSYVVYDVSGDTFKVYVAGGGSYTGGVNFSVLNIWRHPPVTKSSGAPAAGCVAENWWYNTSNGRMWWCVGGSWVEFIIPDYNSEAYSTVVVNGNKYRFIGIEATSQQVPGYPGSYPAGWATPAATNNTQGLLIGMVMVSGDDVIFDRCYVHGQPKPSRNRYGIISYGNRVGIIESYFENQQEWRTGAYDGGASAYSIYMPRGNQYLIRNNFIECAGICIFSPNDAYNGRYTQPTNVVVARNTFNKLAAWRRTDTQTFQWPNRHAVELKSGAVWRIEGNIFNYNWSGILAGAFILLTPRSDSVSATASIASWNSGVLTLSGYPTFAPGDMIYITGTDAQHNGLQSVAGNGCPSNCLQVSLQGTFTGSGTGGTATLRAPGRATHDIDIRHNSFYQGTELVRWDGTDNDAWTSRKPPLKRLRIHNNLSVDMNIRSYANGGRVDLGGIYQNGFNGAIFNFVVNGDTEDTIVTHNTVYGNRGNMPALLALGDKPNEGLLHSNNLMTFNESGFDAIWRGSSRGTAALNGAFTRDGAPHWSSEKNVLCCGKSASGYPASYQFPAAESTVKWMKPQLTGDYNFRLRHDSPYISGGASRASDDTDVGADLDLLEAVQGRVRNVRLWGLAATSVNIGYLAPDAQACTVEVSTSPIWGTGTRWPDGGGDRSRRVSITGLASQTVYHYRILCAVEQPSGWFRTP